MIDSETMSACNQHVKFAFIISPEFNQCMYLLHGQVPAHMLGNDTHVCAMWKNVKSFSTCSYHVCLHLLIYFERIWYYILVWFEGTAHLESRPSVECQLWHLSAGFSEKKKGWKNIKISRKGSPSCALNNTTLYRLCLCLFVHDGIICMHGE